MTSNYHRKLDQIAYFSQMATEVRTGAVQYIRAILEECPGARRAISDALRMTVTDLNWVIAEYPMSFFDNLNATQSPIEDMFLLEAHRYFNLRAQYPVGPYRLDFAVVEHKIAIELDGHDYHSSKEQRGRDAKRDRYLQAMGWRVFRFTGSEVYKNADGCAREILAVIKGGAA